MPETVLREDARESVEVVRDAKGLHKFTIKFYYNREVETQDQIAGQLKSTMDALRTAFPNGD